MNSLPKNHNLQNGLYTANKYKAKKESYNGIVYHSKREAEFAIELDWRLKAKDIKSWERQIKIDIQVNNVHICNHFIDFEITHKDDSIELIEVKGFETDVWILKRKLLEATFLRENPQITYTVVR